MLLVLLSVGCWSAGLLLVAGLCAAARRGDAEAAAEMRHPAGSPAPAHQREAAQAPVRIAA